MLGTGEQGSRLHTCMRAMATVSPKSICAAVDVTGAQVEGTELALQGQVHRHVAHGSQAAASHAGHRHQPRALRLQGRVPRQDMPQQSPCTPGLGKALAPFHLHLHLFKKGLSLIFDNAAGLM